MWKRELEKLKCLCAGGVSLKTEQVLWKMVMRVLQNKNKKAKVPVMTPPQKLKTEESHWDDIKQKKTFITDT